MPELTDEGTGKYVQAGPIRVYYNEAGSGPAVICTEGQGPGTSGWVVYHKVFPALAEHFRVLLVDQPGYGRSDVVTVTNESRSTMYARTVRDVMDGLGINKASLVDMSFGAQTAQVFAIEYPERVEKLVLHASGVGGVQMFGHDPAEGITVMADTFANPTLQSMRKMMNCFLYDGGRYTDEDLLLQWRLDSWLSRPELDEARKKQTGIQRDLSADVGKITMPALQIHGRNDRVASLERALRLLNMLPDSRLMIFNHCGHWAPIERPAEFACLVIDFLSN